MEGEVVARTVGTQAMLTWLDALCEIQLSPNIVLESELEKADLSQYDLIVLPKPIQLPDTYTGKVIVDGDAAADAKLLWLSDGQTLAAMEVPYAPAQGRAFGEC